jgi:hypothetical protein
MRTLSRILIYIACGIITGAVVWGLIVESIILALDQKHGEGLLHIPSPHIFWLALIVGGMNGVVIGMTLGTFGARKLLRSAVLAIAATASVTAAYYLLIDPGFIILATSGSVTALRNLAGLAVALALPSPVIGIITALLSSAIWRKFYEDQHQPFPMICEVVRKKR